MPAAAARTDDGRWREPVEAEAFDDVAAAAAAGSGVGADFVGGGAFAAATRAPDVLRGVLRRSDCLGLGDAFAAVAAAAPLDGVPAFAVDAVGEDFAAARTLRCAGADADGDTLLDGAFGAADPAGDDLSGTDLAGADLAGADLAGADLAGADLAGADLACTVCDVELG